MRLKTYSRLFLVVLLALPAVMFGRTEIRGKSDFSYFYENDEIENAVKVTDNEMPAPPCRNVTASGSFEVLYDGETVPDNEFCSDGPVTITLSNVEEASGGSDDEDIQYVWMYKTTPGGSLSRVPGSVPSTESSFTVEVSSTMYFVRCSRRACAGSWPGETPATKVTINSNPRIAVVELDQTCDDDGRLRATGSGTCAPYSYEWTVDGSPVGTRTISGLEPGDYAVTVTDNYGCTNSTIGTVTSPVCCNVNNPGEIGSNQTICAGETPATIVSVEDPSGGVGPIEYVWMKSLVDVPNYVDSPHWSGIAGANSASYSPGPLTETTYFLRCSRNVGCDDFFTGESNMITITVNPSPSVEVAATEPTCDDLDGGNLTATASLGTAPYSYLWSNGESTATISGVDNGSYTVTVSDANECATEATEVLAGLPDCCPITIPGVIAANQTICEGTTPDEITSVSPSSGGVGPVEYVWMQSHVNVPNIVGNEDWSMIPGATGESYAPGVLSQTTYYLRCSRNEGCDMYYGESNMVTITITESPAVEVEVATAPTCDALESGSLTATASEGTGPYTYAWSNGETTATISGLAEGSYTVTVTDDLGCEVEEVYELLGAPCCDVTDPGIIAEDQEYCGPTDAALITSVSPASGGVGPPEYLWIQSDTLVAVIPGGPYWSAALGANTGETYDPGVLTETTYFLRCTRNEGCPAFSSESNVVTIIIHPAVDLSLTAEDLLCNGDLNGTVSSTITGGTAPFTYLWSNGETTESIAGLGVGTYSLTITDANGCTASADAEISAPDALTATMYGSSVACYGDETGFATATVSGGTSPYTYLWSNGGTTSTISDLAAGTYSVIISDANGCEYTNEVEVVSPDSLILDLSSTEITCNGDQDGTASVLATGGTTPYTYLWSNGETTASISGLSADTYSVTVRDSNACMVTAEITLVDPALLVIDVTASASTCDGEGHDGSAEVIVTGGEAPYSYLWSNGATTASVSDLDFGTYSVTVTDANGCEMIDEAVLIGRPVCCDVTDPGLIAEDQESCGPFDPAMLTSVTPASGGIGPVEYLWIQSNVLVPVVPGEPYWTPALGANTDASYDPGMLTETTYFLRCTRNEGCPSFSSESNVVIITIHPEPVIATVVVDALCYGDANGTITATVTEGTAPYTYLWSNGQTTATATGLVAGTYTVEVTDANGCTAEAEATVEEPEVLEVELTASAVDCYGNATGTATATVTGGTEDYTYLWSNGETTATISGLVAGNYSVVVTDANGCVVESEEVEVTQPDALTLVMTATAVDCYGNATGTATATVGGGTEAYSYVWSNGETTATISGLTAGIYSVVVTDENGCEITDEVEVIEPEVLEVELTASAVDCYGNATGTATATVTGGTEDYTYLWSNGGTTATISGLVAGNYSVVVTDANGCVVESEEVEVTQPDALTLVMTATAVDCNGNATGTATATVGGGTEDYTYSWSNGGTTATITGLIAGTYSVVITDENGCEITDEVEVTEPDALTLEMTATAVDCNGNATGTATATVGGGTEDYNYLWSNGETTATISGLIAGDYSVVVTDANGCEITESVEVTQPDALTLDFTSENISCNGYEDGSATAIVGGGTLDYSYLWSNGETTAAISGLTAGMYSVTITDANGCTITESVEITEPEVLAIDLVSTFDATCGGEGHDGSAEVTVTGGTAPYSYLWSNGATTASVTDLDFGTYSVDVTDANGCMVSEGTVIIGRPVCCDVTDPGLIAEDQESCGPFDPAMLTSVTPASGGIGPVEYLWIQSNVLVPVVPGEPYWTPALGANTDASYDPGMLTETTYFLRCTRNEGCPSFSSESNVVIITIHPEPVIATVVVDALCYGDANGTITATVTEGTAPYTYLWSNGQTTATATGLVAGTYTVEVTDANGCTAEAEATVEEPEVLEVELTASAVDCYGNATGTATATVTGGTEDYTYLWSNGETTATISGLVAGNYSVVVTDANGCVVESEEVEVTQPDALTLVMTATAVDCYGNATGTATATVGGGTEAYSYVWSNGETTATISGLTAGIYSVVVTDENGCEITDEVEVTEPDALTIEMTATAVDCYGNATGTATATVGGGTEAYSYVWSNGGTTATISGLTAGDYSVVVTDANGCEITESVEVTQPDALTIEMTATAVDCYGNATGSATATVGGGTEAYSYVWSNGETTAAISGLTAGIYSVVVTDANGCEITDEVEVTEPDALTIEMTATELACYGDDNGMATATVGGGTLDYTYSWSNGETTATISDLIAGMYTVIVTDANGCMITDSIEVVQPTELELTINSTNVLCFEESNGTADASVSGGTEDYSYLWSNGATTAVIEDLAAGVYTIVVTDENGCEIVDSVEITEPGHLHVYATATGILCYGDETGTATATVGGGTEDYTYSWTQGGVVVSTENPAIGLAAGSVIITVTDANGCTAIATTTVEGPEAPLSVEMSNDNLACYGDDDATASASVEGGTAPYTYLWSNGETTMTITDLAVGIYTVVVTDANDCEITGSVEVEGPEALTLELTSENITCNGYEDGSATAIVGGGTLDYAYLWSNGETTATISGLTAGMYSVTITDANGCTITESVEITEPEVLAIDLVSTFDATCGGEGHDGSAEVTVTGGTAPYSYLWSNGATTASVTDLDFGTYSVDVTDANGCMVSEGTVIIGRPVCCDVTDPGLIAEDQESCGPFDPAMLTSVTPASGGIGPVEYLWIQSNVLVPVVPGEPYWTPALGANTDATYDPGMLTETTYFLRCTRNEGCPAFSSESNVVIITIHPEPVLATTVVDVLCYGDANGTITATVTEGTAPFTYLWSDGQTTATATDLAPGEYSVTVTDANGCSDIAYAEVMEPSPLTIEMSATDVDCYGNATGTATTYVGGGTGAYTYVWSNGETTMSIEGLIAGMYTVEVTDVNGCMITDSVEVTEPDALTIEMTATAVDCYGNATGSATTTVGGGTAPYTYLWSNGGTTATISDLTAGMYTVVATDENGCEITDSVEVTEPDALTIEMAATAVDCYGNATGSATATIGGGTEAYSYVWSNGGTTATISDLIAGMYTVVVTDANGCEITDSVEVTEPDALTIEITATELACYGDDNASATATVGGGTAPFDYLWSNGETTATISGLTAGIYSVVVTDANGCEITDEVEITEPDALTIEMTATELACYGDDNGMATATVGGGTLDYTYSWSNGETTATISDLTAGMYTVVVTDANGCMITDSIEVVQPTELELDFETTMVLCNLGADGSATVSVTGGTPEYSYLWNTGATTATISDLTAGIYTVTITDANGCEIVDSVEITEPGHLHVFAMKTDVICYGTATGTGTAYAGGGTPDYTYEWKQGGVVVSTENPATNLVAGGAIVKVTDANGCTAIASIYINGPEAFELSINSINNNCYGDEDGEAAVSVTGGEPGYTYLWSNGETTETITGLAAGTYSVVVTDNEGCTIEGEVVITEPEMLTIEMTSTNVSCYDGDNGSATATVGGGTAPYTYLWSNGETTMTIDGLIAGDYTVEITDANGCMTEGEVTITEPEAITIEMTSTNVSCYYGDNGSATATVGGGTAPYTYLWSNGEATMTIEGLVAGDYSVVVTDANGCMTEGAVTITEPEMLTIEISSTNVSCYDGDNGSATAYAAGGTAPYTYLWSNGETTMTIEGIIAGDYSVDITDANGCMTEGTVTITEPEMLTIEIGSTDVLCYGTATGTATASVEGGTAPYEYLWSNGETTMTIEGLIAGDYSVEITDANGCMTEGTVTITEPEMLTIEMTSTNVSCYDGDNGSATATVGGGTAPYTYLWSNGETTMTIEGLIAGDYTVEITDANGCTIDGAVTITEPEMLTIEMTSTNVSCYDGDNGSATATVGGGTAPYTYLWSNGEATMTIEGLVAGDYSVVVTDANGCMTEGTVTITEPEMLTIEIGSTNVLCNGDATGTATAYAAGGTAPYTYLWSNGETTMTIEGLTAGDYSVEITDANGCTIEEDVTITEPEVLVNELTSTDVFCYGGSDGSATAIVSGGTAPYTYLWSNGETTMTIEGLTAGDYTVEITDANGCMTDGAVTITEPEAIVIDLTATHVACYLGADGTATAVVSGGSAPYTYLWSNGETTATISGLIAGMYTVTITDERGCEAIDSVEVTEPGHLHVYATATGILCSDDLNGTATAIVGGGVEDYTFVWTQFGEVVSTENPATDLAAGPIVVTVTDANGCTAIGSTEITSPEELVVELGSTNVLCHGESNGSAEATVTGGTADYSYLWSNGATTASITDLIAGTYSVIVTDANGCETEAEVTITEPAMLVLAIERTHISCHGLTDGSATVTVSGGTAPFTYLWNTGATTATVSDLAAGDYTVEVTDANGCMIDIAVKLNEPDAISITIESTNNNCYGDDMGTATATVDGGTPEYTYMWNTGATTESISDLAAGTYTVVVTDENGCEMEASVTITEPEMLTIELGSTNVLCNGDATGTATAYAAGGTAPYTYLWSNGETTMTIEGLTAGDYSVEITDANGCTIEEDVTITEPEVLVNELTSTDVFCYGGSDGSATAIVSGGTAPYTYLWSNGETTMTIEGLTAGDYTVEITDANGCMTDGAVTITEPEAVIVEVAGTNVSCYGELDGTAIVSVTGGTAPFTYLWSNGASTESISGLAAGTYTVLVTDANGCELEGEVTITEPEMLTIEMGSENVLCNGDATGTATAYVAGGTEDYTYLWSTGETTMTIEGLIAGDYTVEITDANGCMTEGTVTITEPEMLTIEMGSEDVLCNGGSTGTATAYVGGGTEDYTYLWSNGETTMTIDGLIAGDYTVEITDANGCTIDGAVTITEPEMLTIEMTSTNVSCYDGDNGSATATVGGGTAPYTYLWSNGETTMTIDGLIAGDYTVEITDANGCTIDGAVTITEPEMLTIEMTSTNVSCYDGDNGSATATVGGGTAPYTYLWSNGETTMTIDGLIAGDYSVVVTDANGCTIEGETVTITEPAMLTIELGSTDLNCNGDESGTATAYVGGGTAPYTYLWSNGATTESITDIAAGTYSVDVTDANGCTITEEVTITEPSALVIEADVYDNYCYGESEGSINVTVTGGTPTYTYLWSNGETTAVVAGLPAGIYTVTVTDANGCELSETFEVSDPAAIELDIVSTDITCFGSSNGSATVSAEGGVLPYTYLWSNGETTATISGLEAGTYSVTVTDANGCSSEEEVEILEPEHLHGFASSTNVLCYGSATGTGTVYPTGGTAPYTYAWRQGGVIVSTENPATNLSAGGGVVTITDANGCTAAASVFIRQPDALELSMSTVDVACYGSTDGSATAAVTGGTAPYAYLWSDGQTTATASDLTAGAYSVTVTDANGCEISSDEIFIDENSEIEIELSEVSLDGICDGVIAVEVGGGLAPYTYSWSHGADTEDVSGLCAGDYTLTVTDAAGCTSEITVSLVDEGIRGLVHIAVAPNPVLANAQILITAEANEDVIVHVVSDRGQMVIQDLYNGNTGADGEVRVSLDASSFARGCYFVTVISDSKVTVEKIIVQ